MKLCFVLALALTARSVAFHHEMTILPRHYKPLCPGISFFCINGFGEYAISSHFMLPLCIRVTLVAAAISKARSDLQIEYARVFGMQRRDSSFFRTRSSPPSALSAAESGSMLNFEAISNVVFNILLAIAGSRVLALFFAKLAETAAPPLKLPPEDWTRMVRIDPFPPSPSTSLLRSGEIRRGWGGGWGEGSGARHRPRRAHTSRRPSILNYPHRRFLIIPEKTF